MIANADQPSQENSNIETGVFICIFEHSQPGSKRNGTGHYIATIIVNMFTQ